MTMATTMMLLFPLLSLQAERGFADAAVFEGRRWLVGGGLWLRNEIIPPTGLHKRNKSSAS
jgi:hypothetical protein